MKYRPLGPLRVSAVGFGAWGIGGRTPGATSYGHTDDRVSRRALQEALEQGINFFDTSSVYGDGHSESLIGEITVGRRDRLVIATKGGIEPSYRGYDFSAAALRRSLEGSLSRLKTDYIDIFQLHNASAEVVSSLDHLGELFGRFTSEGKVRAFGFSTPAPDDALALIDFPGTACFQVNCNLLDWRAVDIGLFHRVAEKGIGIIARTPMAFGFLTGQFAADSVFDPSDHRGRWPREKIAAWVEAANELFAALKVSHSTDERAAVAVRFCLSFDVVGTVIPGMLDPQEVRANSAAAAHGRLRPDELEQIKDVYRRHEARLRA
jgi:aryl-alcohol dehydrogenase-like predicted oxidoreductase